MSFSCCHQTAVIDIGRLDTHVVDVQPSLLAGPFSPATGLEIGADSLPGVDCKTSSDAATEGNDDQEMQQRSN